MPVNPRRLPAGLSPEDPFVLLAFAEPDSGEARHVDTATAALLRRGLELEAERLDVVVSGLTGLGLLASSVNASAHVFWELERRKPPARVTPKGSEVVRLSGGRRAM